MVDVVIIFFCQRKMPESTSKKQTKDRGESRWTEEGNCVGSRCDIEAYPNKWQTGLYKRQNLCSLWLQIWWQGSTEVSPVSVPEASQVLNVQHLPVCALSALGGKQEQTPGLLLVCSAAITRLLNGPALLQYPHRLQHCSVCVQNHRGMCKMVQLFSHSEKPAQHEHVLA